MSGDHMHQGDSAECAAIPEPPWGMLVRYGRGDESEEEIAALRDWAAEDRSRLAMLDGVRRLGEISGRLRGGSRTDVAWARVQEQTASERRRKSVLRLELGRTARGGRSTGARPRWHGLGIAAAVAVFAVAGGVRLRNVDKRAGAPPQFQEVVAPSGGRMTLRLPDGTRVVLGSESRMRYAVGGDVRVRNVHLTGAALFDVAHDAARPFIVHATGGEAQAVGTSFDVRAYPSDSMLVVVVAEGRVALRPDGGPIGSGTMLEPGQRGVLRRGLVRVESGVDLRRELGWTAGRLVYDLAPLGTIARDLERWFGVRIILPDPSWADVRVTVTLDADSTDASLRRLADVLDVPYRRSGTQVRFGL